MVNSPLCSARAVGSAAHQGAEVPYALGQPRRHLQLPACTPLGSVQRTEDQHSQIKKAQSAYLLKKNGRTILHPQGFPDSSAGKESPAMQETLVQSRGREDPLEKRLPIPVFLGFPCGSAGKESPAMQGTWVQSLGWDDALEKGKATQSSILASRIPWTV